jgi:hypothetical protein
MIHVGLSHYVKELAGIGRQALDIAALSLGIDRIKGEAGLARTGKPGNHNQLVARNVHVDVLEVVFARTAHGDCPEFGHERPLATRHDIEERGESSKPNL